VYTSAGQCAGVLRVTHAEPKHLLMLPSSVRRKGQENFDIDHQDGTDVQQQQAELLTGTENEKPVPRDQEVDRTILPILTPLPPSRVVDLIRKLRSAVLVHSTDGRMRNGME